jgi:threonyl-tRNA synthetase
LPRQLVADDLKVLEKKMKELSKKAFKFEQFDMEINEAIKFLKENNQDFKVEIAEDLKNE